MTLNSCHTLSTLLPQVHVPLGWWRYIDDVFAMWTHSEEPLRLFVETLNSYHTTIKFTTTWSSEEIIFLDTRVYVKNGQLKTDLHVKPTDMHQYLHADSCHPRHCKTAIHVSQTLRLRRICSEQDNLQKQCQELKHHLTNRGYEEQQPDLEIQRALDIPREINSQQHNDQEKSARIPLFAYHTIPPDNIKISIMRRSNYKKLSLDHC